MSEKIGSTAGLVWTFLKEKGPATASQIQKGAGVDAALTNQAIGWLAREGKLKIDRSKKTPTFTLNEQV